MTILGEQIVAHWRKRRPTLLRDLESSGELDAVVAGLERTILEKQAAEVKRGMSPRQAEEALRSMWMTWDEDGLG